MAQVLRPLHNLAAATHPSLLVGFGSGDDAGVFRLADDVALVQTVDFFTPIVDDARAWGRIAAANALSDVYAMAARPVTALQVVGWPRDELPLEVLSDVLEGAASVLETAGCTLVGGHTVDDPEPKFGLAVTGLVHPDDLVTNATGLAGDVLVLTKPIGTGVVATAIKADKAPPDVVAEAVSQMTTLNAGAANAMRRVGVHAATDVTGFGLLGHLGELVRGSGVSAEIDADAAPILPGVEPLLAEGFIPGGTKRNLAAATRFTAFAPALTEQTRLLLADAQTSGGLLIAVDARLEKALHQALADEGVTGWAIGRLVERTFPDGPTGRIHVR